MPVTDTGRPTVELDMMAMFADPYVGFAAMREQNRVAYLEPFQSWWVTGYAECIEGLEQPEVFTSKNLAHIHHMDGDSVLSLDGEDHRRIRQGLVSNLKAVAVQSHTGRFIQPLVVERIAALAGRDDVELVHEFWEPLTVATFRELLAVPDVTDEQLRGWFQRMAAGAANFMQIPEVAQAAREASDEITEFLTPRLEGLPPTSLVAHLYSRALGETPEEKARDILPTIKVIIGAGEQEPGHGGSTVLAGALSTPFRDALAADPDANVDLAIEEGLRWVCPVQAVSRFTSQDTTLAGVDIPAGEWVNFALASANRDAAVFGADAEEFRVGREHPHLAFSAGKHTCAGAQFGKAVIRTAVVALFEAYPDLRLADREDAAVFEGFGFRAPDALHVTLGKEKR